MVVPSDAVSAGRQVKGNRHKLVNNSTGDVIYLEVGDRTPGDEVSYPEDDLQALRIDDQWRFAHKDGRPY